MNHYALLKCLLFSVLTITDLNACARSVRDDYINAARTANEKGQYQRAIEDLSKVIELDPKDALTYQYRGLAYAKLGKRDLADKDQKKAKELGYKPDQK